jgi:hypothetical protein
MLTIGSVYGHGFGSGELDRLEALGFRLRPQVGAYAGSQSLRFIDFASGPALELIEVEDQDEYLAFVPDGMAPHCPGISLLLAPHSEAFIGGYERRFAQLGPYRLHVNYDGSTQRDQPGWTYLNFTTPVVAGTFTWLTALDEPRPEPERETAHPNSALRLLGLAFELEAGALDCLAELAGAIVKDGAFRLGEQTVWTKKALAGLPIGRKKAFPLRAIVVEASHLDFFSAPLERVTETTFLSQRAVLIETNELCWDLVLVAAR